MRKIYLTLALLIAAVANIYAGGIASLDSLSNTKVYYITCAQSSRGTWYFNPEHPDTLYGTKMAGATADYEDPNCQFAFIKSPGKGFLYFYSVGGKKFIHATGDHYVYLTDEPVSAQNQLVRSEKNSYPWVAQDNGYHFNLSSNQYCGLLASWWSLSDKGNTIKIDAVDDVEFDPTDALAKIDAFEQTFCVVNITYREMYGDSLLSTYTQQKLVDKGQTISFDGPQSFFALKATNDTPSPLTVDEDQDMTVTYNFVTDEDALPFKTIASDATTFPDDTPWYFMTIGEKYASLQEDGVNLSATASKDHPINRNALFAFTGDPVNGFYIHNMATDDVLMSLYAQPVSDEVVTMGDEGTKFVLEHNLTDGYEFRFADNGILYISTNDNDGVITYNNLATGCTNATTTVNFVRLTDAEKEMLENNTETLTLDSTDPEQGDVNGSLKVVYVYYDGNISSIKADDDSNLIKAYDQNGKLKASVNGQIKDDDPTCMVIDFGADSLTTRDKTTYTIVIPEKTIYGENGKLAQGTTLTYNVIGEFRPVTVTGRLWNKRIVDRIDETPIQDHLGTWTEGNWDYPIAKDIVCPLIDFSDGQEYMDCKVLVIAKNEVKIYGFDGVENDSIDIVYDNDSEWGDFTYINGESYIYDSGYKYWTVPSAIVDSVENYGYMYIYADTNSGGSNAHIYPADEYGYVNIAMYDWLGQKYSAMYIDFYLDDRYKPNEEPEEDAVNGIAAQTPAMTGYYNLAGQRIDKIGRKGIYIVNGKKVVMQ